MASRRTFLKSVGLAVGAGAIGTPEWAIGAPKPSAQAVQHRSGSVFIGDAEGDTFVVCALVTTNIQRTRQMMRRAKRKILSGDDLARNLVLQPGSVSLQARRLVYKQLSRVPPTSVGGFEIFSASVPNAWRWKGSESELFRLTLEAVLANAGLMRFKRVSVYANTGNPAARALLTGMIRDEFAHRYQPVKRFDVFPDQARKHDGLQAARWAAFAIQQKAVGRTSEWYTLLKTNIKKEVDLSVIL